MAAITYGDITVGAAKDILKYAEDNDDDEKDLSIAGLKNALAILLNSLNTTPEMDDYERQGVWDSWAMASELYKQNLSEETTTTGPEKFYALVGLAEFFQAPTEDDESADNETTRWQELVKNSGLALKQRDEEKEALGSELDNRRCTSAFWWHAESLTKVGRDNDALVICRKALMPNVLQYSHKQLDFLNTIITILSKTGEWRKIIEEVQCRSHKMRAEWMFNRLGDIGLFVDSDDLLRKAGVLSSRVDIVITFYVDAIDYWQPLDWFKAQCLALQLALVYRRDARVTKMAELILDNINKEIMGGRKHLSGGIDILRFVDISSLSKASLSYFLTNHFLTERFSHQQ